VKHIVSTQPHANLPTAVHLSVFVPFTPMRARGRPGVKPAALLAPTVLLTHSCCNTPSKCSCTQLHAASPLLSSSSDLGPAARSSCPRCPQWSHRPEQQASSGRFLPRSSSPHQADKKLPLPKLELPLPRTPSGLCSTSPPIDSIYLYLVCLVCLVSFTLGTLSQQSCPTSPPSPSSSRPTKVWPHPASASAYLLDDLRPPGQG
jgi:hypothetical protein